MVAARTAWLAAGVAILCATPPSLRAACLTATQARELWPDAHLYWYSGHDEKCWSNRRGPPVGLKIEPIPDAAAVPKPDTPSPLEQVAPNGPRATILYPELRPGAGIQPRPILSWHQPWFAPQTIMGWPLLIDIDRTPFVAWDKRIQ